LYNADETKWLWGGAQTGTKTVIYNVTIPSVQHLATTP
jgi:hypothetical protein